MFKGSSSHWAYGFTILSNTGNIACEVSQKMLGSRNPEQFMFSLLFSPELVVDGNFHTSEESVMVGAVLRQWCFDHSPAKPELSLISPASKYYRWGHSVSKTFPSYTLCSANVKCSSTSAVTGVFQGSLEKAAEERNRQNVGQESEAQRRWKTWLQWPGRCLGEAAVASATDPWVVLPSKKPLSVFVLSLHCLVIWLLLWSSGLTTAAQCLSQVPWLPEVSTGLCFQVLL